MSTDVMLKRIPLVIGALVIASLLGALYFRSPFSYSDTTRTARESGVFTVGKPAPNFDTVDFDHMPVRLSYYFGKPIIVDFWAAWCVFCRDEMPVLERIHQQYGDEIAIIGIHRTDSGESIARGAQFAQEQGVTYPLMQDQSGALYKMATQGLSVMPVAIFIDSSGIVQEIKFGPKTEDEIYHSALILQ